MKSKILRDMETFEKVICLGSVKGERNVFCSITYDDKGNLSITGVVGPRKNGNARGSCGQIRGQEIDVANIKEGWSQELISEFYTIWKNWHLNDLQAGCEHQRAERWEDRLLDDSKPKTQSNMATWTYKKDNPKGLLCEPCSICGYKYGSAWLRKEIPYHVLRFLKMLRETKKEYAWV